MAKAKPAKIKASSDSFVVNFRGTPALEVRLISNVVVDDIHNSVNGWLVSAAEIERDNRSDIQSACVRSGCTPEETANVLQDYETKLASCSLHAQTPELAEAHFRSHLPRAIQDLLHLLVDEAYYYTATDLHGRCLFPHHYHTHKTEDRYAVESLFGSQSRLMADRLGLPYRDRRGGKPRMIRAPEQIVMLAKEYENLLTAKRYGDRQDKTLWEIICHRYDINDPNWRERAKLDNKDVPDVVLDLVTQRRKFKLRQSHLALYHAAARAGIGFTIETHDRTGKPFLKPSPRTLLRLCDENRQGRKKKQNRRLSLVTQTRNYPRPSIRSRKPPVVNQSRD